MSYTKIDDERIDKKIDGEMGIVCEEILKVVNPVSIILFGGFGRGEGTAQIHGDDVTISKDYDTLLVVKKKIPPALIYEMSANIHRRLGRTNPLDSINMEMGAGVSLVQYTMADLLYFRDAKTYEIKMSSKLIWGEDIRDKIPVRAEDLTPWNGIRFLLRKPPGLCACFRPEYLQQPPEGEAKETIIHECHRVYLDGGVLMTILAGIYRPTYSARALVIKESLESKLPDLVERIPGLPEKIERLTEFKMFPSEEKYAAIDPVKLWLETRKDLGIILSYFMERHLGVETRGLAELFDAYNDRLNKEFVDELAYFYLKKRFRVASQPLARLANLAYQRLFCLKYMLKLNKRDKVIYPKTLLNFPTFRISTSGLMLLFSLNEDSTLDRNLFDAFKASLRHIYPLEIRNSGEGDRWQEASDIYVKADRIFLDTFYGWG